MKSTKSGQSNFIEQPTRRRICTSWIVPLLLLWMLPAGLSLMMAGRATAQVFTTLGYGYISGGLVLSGNTLYGTADGGYYRWGTVFAVNTDGTGFTNLANIKYASYLNGLVLSGNTLYGMMLTTEFLVVEFHDYSTVFALNTDGTGLTNLYSFNTNGWGRMD